MPEIADSRQIAPAEGIWAYVTIDIAIQSYDEHSDRVHAVIEIEAKNQTKDEILLNESYRLPARKAFIAKAQTSEGRELRTSRNDREIEVHFNGATIPVGGSFGWSVEYDRMTEIFLGGILAYDRHIDPQNTFQNIPIREHQFDIRFTLEQPSGERWGALRRWRIHQRNSLSLIGKRQYKPGRTIYRIDKFALAPNQTFDIRLACVYDWVGWIAHTFQIVLIVTITTILEHAPAFLIALWNARNAHK